MHSNVKGATLKRAAWIALVTAIVLTTSQHSHSATQTNSALTSTHQPREATPPTLGALLHSDAFNSGLNQWHIEAKQPGKITAVNGVLDIDVPAGATLWFTPELGSPVAIVFEATAVSAGGPNDRVSDLNVFWMARNRDGATPVYAHHRSGEFSEYNDLRTYYVGLGGNANTTTRFRRYIGDPEMRPLLPEHDLSSPDALLKPNEKQTIMLVANSRRIEYWRDGRRLLAYDDHQPYEHGWFALRTVQSHLHIERLRIYAIR
jgi:hypothetical protein